MKAGRDVCISIPRWKNLPEEINRLQKTGINIKFNTDSSAMKKAFNRLLPSSLQSDNRYDGFEFLKSIRPDLVVINQGGNTGGIELMEYCMAEGLKFVTISQAANEAKWPDDKLSKRLSEAFPSAVVNYFVSRANLFLTEMEIGQSIVNSKIIFNPFNVGYDEVIEYPAVKNFYCLANVSRHEVFAKGQDILFRVLNEKKWRERNLAVRLYGKGEHTISISKMIKFFDLKNVSVEGHINPSDIWRSNHALILTSRYEGLPLALVEAMLCRRLGIVTGVSGNPEIIVDNENGFLAEAAAPDAVDEAMERAWQRRESWKEIGEAAGSYIRKIIPADPVEFFFEELNNLEF